MARLKRVMFAACCALALAAPAPPADAPAAKKPTEDDIARAVRDLGSSRFALRERATKVLWEAGAAAEPALAEAARSSDPEVAMRAKTILEKFRWGIYPDTPEPVLKEIERFRTGAPDAQRDAVTELIKLGRPGYAALKKLVRRIEDDTVRANVSAHLVAQARRQVPGLLAAGEFDAAEEMLEIGLLGSDADAAKDYAAFQFLAGKLDRAVGRLEAERDAAEEPERKRLAGVLAYLYRVQQNWGAARAAAEQSGDPVLVRDVMWEQGDWKGLAKWAEGQPGDSANALGVLAAYHRLAGNDKKFKEVLTDIRNQIDLNTENTFELRNLAEALLLNDRAADAIAVLKDKQKNVDFLFELLCAQLKYKEAFDLAAAGRKDELIDELERQLLEVRRARMLGLLGHKDAAAQLFARSIDAVNRDNNWALARELVRCEVRAGMREQALAHASECLAILLERDGQHEPEGLLEPLFGPRKEAARTLWLELREKYGDLKPPEVMRRVDELLSGKAGEKLAEWTAGIDRRGVRPESDRLGALGEAYLAAGEEDKAEALLLRAAEASREAKEWLRLGDFLMRRKRYRDAAERYGEAWQRDRANPLPLFLRGLALARAGNEADGRRLIRLAHLLPLGDEQTRAEMADELAKRGFRDEARQEVEVVLRTGWYRYWFVGNVLNRASRDAAARRRFHDAARYYEKALVGLMRTGANFVEPNAYLVVPQTVLANDARGYLAEGKIDEALRAVEAGLELVPGNVDLAIAIVPELDRAGRKEDADRVFNRVWGAYEAVVKDYPNSHWALNSAAWLAANCRRELEAAQKLSERAVELVPESAGYLDTLAEVHFRRGHKDKAIELMKKCVAMDGDNPYFRRQLERFKKGDITSPVPDEAEE